MLSGDIYPRFYFIKNHIMKCHYCKNHCIKKGVRKDGIQKFQCVTCKKYQLYEYKNKACHPQTNDVLKKCLIRGVGQRGIAYILQISRNTVTDRIHQIAKQIKHPKITLRREYEMDELKTYVQKKKNEQWLIYAIDKRTREVVAYKVGKRNKKNLKLVTETLLLSDAKKIYTDRLLIYKSLIPRDKHKTSPHSTNHIERMNLNLRTHLKCLSRKTLCFSKSIALLNAIIKIYFWAG